MLGEKVTTEISKKEKPKGLVENKQVAKRGGNVAGNARKDAEKELGHGIVSKENYLDSPVYTNVSAQKYSREIQNIKR